MKIVQRNERRWGGGRGEPIASVVHKGSYWAVLQCRRGAIIYTVTVVAKPCRPVIGAVSSSAHYANSLLLRHQPSSAGGKRCRQCRGEEGVHQVTYKPHDCCFPNIKCT